MAKKKKPGLNPLRRRAKADGPAAKRGGSPKRKRQTPEAKRGGQFVRHLKVLSAIHKNHDGKPFNKRMLADWLRDEFDRDLDDLSAFFVARAAATGATSTPMPTGLAAIQEASRDRNAERAIKSLKKFGLEIKRTDEFGRTYKKKKKAKVSKAKRSKAKKPAAGTSSVKVWWTYDPTGPVAKDLQRLFTDFKLTGYELEGIMGCKSLLEGCYGLPMERRVRKVFNRITAAVPPSLLREAAEQAKVWRYVFRRPAKYESRKHLLQTLNDATILRKQCTIKYLPGNTVWKHYLTSDAVRDPVPRRIAVFGTVFRLDEDSIFLIGCEPDKAHPGKWQKPVPYKFDRVVDLTMEDDDNPLIVDIPSHPRIKAVDGMPTRLDLEKLFADSAGAFFRYDKTHSLEVRIHDPEQIALCLERPFHPQQKVIIGPGDDAITLTVESCFLDEVLPRLLAMKNGFRVVQPVALAMDIHSLAGDVAARHG
jgi:hypothetical protein